MSNIDAKLIALKYSQCINDRDIHGLSALMADDYVFIDSSNEIHTGKERMVEGWMEFFHSYPDYRNYFSIVESRDNLFLMIGHSTCSYDSLDGPELWTAKVKEGLVTEWRVYLDTLENRKIFNLPC